MYLCETGIIGCPQVRLGLAASPGDMDAKGKELGASPE